jgi:hypothetical protein
MAEIQTVGREIATHRFLSLIQEYHSLVAKRQSQPQRHRPFIGAAKPLKRYNFL